MIRVVIEIGTGWVDSKTAKSYKSPRRKNMLLAAKDAKKRHKKIFFLFRYFLVLSKVHIKTKAKNIPKKIKLCTGLNFKINSNLFKRCKLKNGLKNIKRSQVPKPINMGIVKVDDILECSFSLISIKPH